MSKFNPFAQDPWKTPDIPKPRPVRKQTCPQCRGRGQVWKGTVWEFGWKPCPACKGTGEILGDRFHGDKIMILGLLVTIGLFSYVTFVYKPPTTP